MPSDRPLDNLSDGALKLAMELAERDVQLIADPDEHTLYYSQWQDMPPRLRNGIKRHAAELIDWLASGGTSA